MKIVLLFCFLTLGLYSNAQKKNFVLIDEIYSNWLKSYSKGPGKCNLFLYSDTIDSYTIEIVKNQFLEDSIFLKYSPKKDTSKDVRIKFSSIERSYIIEQLNNLNMQAWPDEIFPMSRVVHFNKIDSIQKSVNAKKLDPLLRLCYTVYIFTHPIFLRQNTICLFYSGKTNFAVMEGEFWIFKKEGQNWIKYSPLYQWIE